MTLKNTATFSPSRHQIVESALRDLRSLDARGRKVLELDACERVSRQSQDLLAERHYTKCVVKEPRAPQNSDNRQRADGRDGSPTQPCTNVVSMQLKIQLQQKDVYVCLHLFLKLRDPRRHVNQAAQRRMEAKR